MLRPVPGVITLELHGKNRFQARVALSAALRRADGQVYRIRAVHGHTHGTALRDMLRAEFASHPRVLRLESVGEGATDLVLREL